MKWWRILIFQGIFRFLGLAEWILFEEYGGVLWVDVGGGEGGWKCGKCWFVGKFGG